MHNHYYYPDVQSQCDDMMESSVAIAAHGFNRLFFLCCECFTLVVTISVPLCNLAQKTVLTQSPITYYSASLMALLAPICLPEYSLCLKIILMMCNKLSKYVLFCHVW